MIGKVGIIRKTRNRYTRGLSKCCKYLVTILMIFCFADSELVYSQKRMISVEDAKIVLRRTIIELGGCDSLMHYSILPIPMTYKKFLQFTKGKPAVPHDIALPNRYVQQRLLLVGFARPEVPEGWVTDASCIAYIDAYDGKVLYFFEAGMPLPKKWKP